MTPAHDQSPLTAVSSLVAAGEPSPYQPCQLCGAPLDERQRYCLACGTRRKHADDPAARFLSAATRRRRTAVATTPLASPRRRGVASLSTAAAIAVIPLALGAGVLIGRSSAGGDGKLIAALHAEKAPVIVYSGTGAGAGTQAGTAVAAHTATPVSTFRLAHGYAVELATLPRGTEQPAAAKAEQADQAKGAPAVGVIAQTDFRVTPSPPAGSYVLYSGSYSTKQAAARALARLGHKFPAAKVIEVRAAGSSASVSGRVLTKTVYGAAHQVAGYKPNAQALSQGSQVANRDSHSTGTTASGAGLPDVVAVP